ncbi:unnamed protein product, partial [Mesorhabditis spiculigera]
MPQQLLEESAFKNFIKPDSLRLVHFYASWAPQCQELNTALDDLKAELKAPFEAAYVDAEGLPQISLAYKVTAAPTVIFYKAGKEVSRVNGYQVRQIREAIVEQGTGAPATAAPAQQENLDDRLKRLINSHKLMLFMKGNAEKPQCGFSRRTIELLNNVNADFGTFDILQDNSVREGLKTFSNWPTYPQIYLNGELLGGLDVFAEELKDEEFVKSLPRKELLNDRLKRLITTSRLMLFMKGNPQQPKCGFSRQTVEMLNGISADYKTFDILSDETVRQGLKEYSDWPTFPQIYLDGELIGGLDILRDELKDEEFLAKIPKRT